METRVEIQVRALRHLFLEVRVRTQIKLHHILHPGEMISMIQKTMIKDLIKEEGEVKTE